MIPASHAGFFESRIHETHKVLGLRLRPLCLLDIVALEAIGSPFVFAGSNGATGVDLAKAVSILSKPHAPGRNINANIAQPDKSVFLRLHLFNFFGGLGTELKKLEAYFGDHFTAAEVWRETGGGSGEKSGSHWTQSYAAFLSRETSMTQDEIWLGSIGHVLWLSATVEEQISNATVSNELVKQYDANADKEREAHAALKTKEIAILEAELTSGAITQERFARLNQLKGKP
jgi:hypothetical protein